MNSDRQRKAILLTGTVFAVLFVCMIAYTTWTAWASRRSLMSNSYNRRQKLYARSVSRGNIYSEDGDLLAYTVFDEDGTQRRVYPYGKAFAHVVGYAVQDKGGIEAYANYDLLRSDIPIREKTQTAAEGSLFPGNHVVTTLDAGLQRRVYEALGDYRGAVIVSDPRTGRINAMVSAPSFDPQTVDENWEAYMADEDGVLVNRATQGLYPAGSVFKIITTLAYIRSHPQDYLSYAYDCYGSFSMAGETIHCYDSVAHGHIDLNTSFALSCNASFVNAGLAADKTVYKKTLDELRFNNSLPYAMPYNRSVTIDPRKAEVSDVMQLAIGQGDMLTSPLHINMITCAIANDGVLMQPYLMETVTDADGEIKDRFEPKSAGRFMTEKEARQLREMMRGVVTDGTGIVLADAAYRAAGKTGSAEHREDDELQDSTHAWFTGFAPYDDPEVCVTLILEDAGSSGSYAVPLARRVFDAYFGY